MFQFIREWFLRRRIDKRIRKIRHLKEVERKARVFWYRNAR